MDTDSGAVTLPGLSNLAGQLGGMSSSSAETPGSLYYNHSSSNYRTGDDPGDRNFNHHSRAHEYVPTDSLQPSTSGSGGVNNTSLTYDDIFPALSLSQTPSNPTQSFPTTGSLVGSSTHSATTLNQKMKLKSSNVSVIHLVPAQSVRSVTGSRKGPEAEQAKICKEIMHKTNTQIEISKSTKDGSLTFVITGKEDAVNSAKRLIGMELQTHTSAEISIKKDHHKFILGKAGKKLADLQTLTGTKISVPRQESDSEVIKIVGPKEGIDKAIREIKSISNEVSARSAEKIIVEKEFHPFVSGAFGETVKKIMNDTGSKIVIPPPSSNKNEISITGEDLAVAAAKEAILSLVQEKKKKTKTIHVEVKKQQHRYVIGPKGQTLQEILKQTGVSIEMPPLDNPSETITLRGEQEKLGPALTLLYEKAHSEVEEELAAPAWLQKYIIGPKGSHLQEISQDFQSTVNVSFAAAENKIKIRGPQKDVDRAKEVLEAEVRRIKKEVAVRELKVDGKYHRFLIGKNGQTINQIRAKTGAQITIPVESDQSSSGDVIRIEGKPSEVESAKSELEAIIKKRMETESNVSKDLIIDQRFHKQMIGTKGENIRDIRDRFNQVVIAFPETNVKSDKVTVRGPKEDVDACCKYLAQLNKELLANNTRIEVPIFKQFHKFLIGKDGANIKKIRDDTNTKIELPAEGSDSEVIVITGKKGDVEEAKKRIEAFQKELTNVVQVDIMIPSRFHNSIIGAKGRLIRSIMEECGGVQIKFPDPGSGSDKVSIRGPKDCVSKAKNILVEMSNEKQENGFTVEIKAKPEYHRFLIGKNGANIKKVRESTGARVTFPSEKDEDADTIVIVGKKEDVLKAKTEVQEMIRDLERTVEEFVNVDPKYHYHFVSRKGLLLKQIADEFGGVSISFPRPAEKDNPRVSLKGAKECVSGAKARILEEVSRLQKLVTVQVEIDQQHHRSIMGPRGNNIKEIQANYNVQIKFPEKSEKTNGHERDTPNGDIGHSDDAASETSEASTPKKTQRRNIIVLVGMPGECEAAKKSLLDLIPLDIEVEVPYDYHRFIIGQKGKEVRELMERYDVSISVPPSNEKKDTIRITGSAEKTKRAKDAILHKVQQLDADKHDRELRSFRTELHVDPHLHPKIIGKKGAVINRIRTKYDVQIQFPERNASSSLPSDQTLITIIGYEEKVQAAKEDISAIVKELESQVSKEIRVEARVHPRLIGARGKNIRAIMQKFSVDIRFPRSSDPDPNIVTISGQEEDVEAAKDHILNLEEEYLEDEGTEYLPPRLPQSSECQSKGLSGFVVKGAPWEQVAPDTSNKEEFPLFGLPTSCDAVNENGSASSAWGRSTQ